MKNPVSTSSLVKILSKPVNMAKRTYFSFSYLLSGNVKRIRKYKSLYAGKRCFIIGNGPSLRIDDLNKLKDEFTFAANRIYTLFDKTDWRPTFYCAYDQKIFSFYNDEIIANKENLGKGGVFLPWIIYNNTVRSKIISSMGDSSLFFMTRRPHRPDFSSDISKCIYMGGTVTNAMLQIAIYLGFTQIYLLGTDFTRYGLTRSPHAEGMGEHKYSGAPDIYERAPLFMQETQHYCRTNGVKIYNATRGGDLEVFERIDMNKILGCEIPK